MLCTYIRLRENQPKNLNNFLFPSEGTLKIKSLYSNFPLQETQEDAPSNNVPLKMNFYIHFKGNAQLLHTCIHIAMASCYNGNDGGRSSPSPY